MMVCSTTFKQNRLFAKFFLVIILFVSTSLVLGSQITSEKNDSSVETILKYLEYRKSPEGKRKIEFQKELEEYQAKYKLAKKKFSTNSTILLIFSVFIGVITGSEFYRFF